MSRGSNDNTSNCKHSHWPMHGDLIMLKYERLQNEDQQWYHVKTWIFFDSWNFLQVPSQHANYRRNSFLLPPIIHYWWTSAVNKIVNSDHSNLRRPFCSICDQCHASHGRHVTDFRYSQKYFWEIVPWNDFRLTIFSFLEMLVKMGFFISTCILRCHWWWSRQYFVMISSTEQMVCGEDRGYDDAVGHYDTALE